MPHLYSAYHVADGMNVGATYATTVQQSSADLTRNSGRWDVSNKHFAVIQTTVERKNVEPKMSKDKMSMRKMSTRKNVERKKIESKNIESRNVQNLQKK
jgi:hypothetical protein